MNRREALKGAVWAVPIIAAAIATPLTAASEPEPTQNRIRFTNVTATVGARPNTVYFNTKVQVVDGPAPVQGLIVTVVFRQGGVEFTHTQETPHLPGWGGTPIFRIAQDGFTSDAPVEVYLTATANNVTMITDYATVTPPRWWN